MKPKTLSCASPASQRCGVRLCCLWLSRAFKSLMTDGRIQNPCPCLVVLNQAFENPLRRQTVMPKYLNGRVADAECFAGIDLGIRVANRPLHKLRVVCRLITQAVVDAADEQIALHFSLPISRPETHRKPPRRGFYARQFEM